MSANSRKRFCVVANIGIVRIRKSVEAVVACDAVQTNQALRFRQRQRTPEHGIHIAEDSSVCADTERQRHNRNDCESRTIAQSSQAVPDVLQQWIEETGAANVAASLFGESDASESPHGGFTGVIRGH